MTFIANKDRSIGFIGLFLHMKGNEYLRRIPSGFYAGVIVYIVDQISQISDIVIFRTPMALLSVTLQLASWSAIPENRTGIKKNEIQLVKGTFQLFFQLRKGSCPDPSTATIQP